MCANMFDPVIVLQICIASIFIIEQILNANVWGKYVIIIIINIIVVFVAATAAAASVVIIILQL